MNGPSIAAGTGGAGSGPWTSADVRWMRRALAFAARGGVAVDPNPRVGAVIVANGRLIAGGWHRTAGGPHAEREALSSLAPGWSPERLKRATLYVTLEPCNHHGLTPPCTEPLLQAGIGRIVIAMRDPNPHVRGGGVEILREAGVNVSVGCLEREARMLNRTWVHMMERGRPRLTGFLVRTLDGGFHSPDSGTVPASVPSRVRRYYGPRSRNVTLEDISAAGLARFTAQQIHGVLLETPSLVSRALGDGLLDALVVIHSACPVPPGSETIGSAEFRFAEPQRFSAPIIKPMSGVCLAVYEAEVSQPP